MSPREEYFETFELKKGELVPFNNNKTCKFHGIGKVRHKLFGDHELLLYDVRYIPELKINLLSISMFNDVCYCTKTKHGVLKDNLLWSLLIIVLTS